MLEIDFSLFEQILLIVERKVEWDEKNFERLFHVNQLRGGERKDLIPILNALRNTIQKKQLLVYDWSCDDDETRKSIVKSSLVDDNQSPIEYLSMESKSDP